MADLDRLIREQHPEVGQPRVPVPQYQKVGGVGYEKVTGQHGGAHAVLLGPNGQPISSVNRLPVEVAGEVGIAGGSIGVTGNVGITGVAANTLQIIADNQGRLYGRTAGGSWLPVRVNNDGQLELAQNVTIDNVTVNVGAEVKVNNTPEDPVNVQLSGTIFEEIMLVNAIAIADTERYTFGLRDITGWDNVKALQYKRWVIGVVNSHDKPADCSISMSVGHLPRVINIFNKQRALPSFGYAYFGSKSPGEGAPSAVEMGKSICYPIPILDGGGFTDLQFSISFQESPTSGALTIRVYAFV